jgi:pimeloyl-ACP methyl ester carboxylesterase
MSTITLNSLTFHYLDYGLGDPVLFLHGNVASARWWLPTIVRLPVGLRAVALDMRGYGLSDKPGTGYTVAQRAADLQAFVTALELERFHLVGHSLGGAVALQFALEDSAPIRSLTLLDPAPIEGLTTPPEKYAAIPHILANRESFAKVLRPVAPAGPFDDTWERLVDDGFLTDPSAWVGSARTLEHWNIEQEAAGLKVPTQLIWGADDSVVGRSSAERAARAILGCKLVILEGVGHSPNVERPDQFARLLVEFFGAAV